MKSIISWHLPVKTASEGNLSEHWTKKSKRHKIQKEWIKWVYLRDKPTFKIPVTVVLTRIAPRRLDVHDNLRMSFKYIVDAIADCIIPGKKAGRADDSSKITWHYLQEKGKPKEYAIRIEIYETPSC